MTLFVFCDRRAQTRKRARQGGRSESAPTGMRYDKKPDPFYKSKAWRQLRLAALQRDHYLCVDCMAANQRGEMIRPRPATVVHHVLPVEQRLDLALDIDNLVSLCDACHNKRHPEKGGGEPRPEPPGSVRVIKV